MENENFWTRTAKYINESRPIKFLKHVLKDIPVFEPSSKIKFTWDMLNMISIMIFFFYIPISVAISESVEQISNFDLLIVAACIQFLDPFFNLNAG